MVYLYIRTTIHFIMHFLLYELNIILLDKAIKVYNNIWCIPPPESHSSLELPDSHFTYLFISYRIHASTAAISELILTLSLARLSYSYLNFSYVNTLIKIASVRF